MINEKPQKWMFDEVDGSKKSVIDTSYRTGHLQHVVLYLKCDGCECNTSNFEDWIVHGEPGSECTDFFEKPAF